MKKMTSALLSLMAFVAMAVVPSMAFANAGCCPGACCAHQCCHRAK